MITRNEKDTFQDEALWKRVADRTQPAPSVDAKKRVLEAARLAAEKRQTIAREQASSRPSPAMPWWLALLSSRAWAAATAEQASSRSSPAVPWWLALLSPRAWAAATAAFLVVFGVLGWQHHSVTRAISDPVHIKVAPVSSIADDTALLLETDKRLDAVRQNVSGIMQNNDRTAYVDFTLKTVRHSAGALWQQTSGAVVASAEL
jgi:hypothetical protein